MKICPACESKTGLREIAYGMPIFQDGISPTMDESEYVFGGCCISDYDPTLKCIDCGWKGGSVNNAPGLGREIQAIELRDISKMSDPEIESYAKEIWQKLAKPSKGDNGGSSES